MRRTPFVTALLLLAAACRDGSAPQSATVVILADVSNAVGIGDTVQLVARVPRPDGSVDPRARFTWTSLTPALASVDSTGLAVARDTGTAVIVAMAGRSADTTSFAIGIHPRTMDVTVSPDSALLGSGVAPLVSVTVRDGLGRAINGVDVDVRSSDELRFAIRRFAGRPVVVAQSDGEATIHVEAGPLGATRTMRVVLPGHPLAVASPARIAIGEVSACVLDALGEVSCWGAGGYGNLGRGAEVNGVPLSIAPVAGNLRFTMLDVDGTSACGIAMTRRVHCWGTNGVPTRTSVPTVVLESASMRDVSVGMHDQSCAVEVIGALWCWGRREDGTYEETPRRVSASGQSGAFVRVDVGAAGSLCAVASTGAVYCRGAVNAARGLAADAMLVVDGLPPLAHVAVGDRYACGLTPVGVAWCWGASDRGQLGQGAGAPDASGIQRVAGGLAFVEIAASARNTGARTADGEVWCWGNGGASYGNAWTGWSSTPLLFSRVHRFATFDMATFGMAALLGDGSGFRWAGNPVPPPVAP